MDDSFFIPASRLFAEDFDAPPAPTQPPEQEVVQPVYSAADLAAARDEGAREGREIGLAEAEESSWAAARSALTDLAALVAAAREEASAVAEQFAEAVASLLLGCFATAFPALSVRHGADEVSAVMRTILPTMRREPNIVVRLNPHMARGMTDEMRRLDPELLAHVRIVPTDAIPPGDVRIAWDNGGAARDTRALWAQIENILAPAGLLTTPVTSKEHALVE